MCVCICIRMYASASVYACITPVIYFSNARKKNIQQECQ